MPTVPVVAAAHCAVMVGGAMAMPQLPVVVVARPAGVEAVTFTVKAEGPALVGVPLTTPLAASRVKPSGSAPLANSNLYGAVPPLAIIAELYATPTVPVVLAVHCAVIVGGLMVIPQLPVVVVAL